jgi:hypothetical protein
MHPDLRSVHQHMLGLGLGALAHANWHSNYFSTESEYWSELSILQAAHAAEILIKARIAEEHPLLIFDQLPRSTQVGTDLLGFQQLIKRGRTIQYFELPERLWAATGLRLANLEQFNEFGKLRNTVQHFALPENRDFSQATIEFIYSVIDPFINECWGLCAIDYNEDYEPHIYLVESLVRRGILFCVSPEAAAAVNQAELPWPNDEYHIEMESRFLAVIED